MAAAAAATINALHLLGATDEHGSPLFRCHRCGRAYKTKYTCRRHERVECGLPAMYSCSLCNYRAKHKHSVKQHFDCVHKKKLTIIMKSDMWMRSVWCLVVALHRVIYDHAEHAFQWQPYIPETRRDRRFIFVLISQLVWTDQIIIVIYFDLNRSQFTNFQLSNDNHNVYCDIFFVFGFRCFYLIFFSDMKHSHV